MNTNPIKSVYNFNQEAGLLELGYSDERECAYPIEEALEGLNDLECLRERLQDENFEAIPLTPKAISREIIALATLDDARQMVSDVDRFDKHLDIIVFSLGSIFKLGLSPQQMMKGLGIVANANMTKLKAGKDEHGKQNKPADFISPEPLLQLILNERTSDGN